MFKKLSKKSFKAFKSQIIFNTINILYNQLHILYGKRVFQSSMWFEKFPHTAKSTAYSNSYQLIIESIRNTQVL
jgi:hypothetical protein